MTATTMPTPTAAVRAAPALFAGAILTSAALLFLVQPMIAKMILPKLGGSPAVWNASMAFFQAMLLVGYLYAHLMQKLPTLKAQVVTHILVLAAAASILPLQVSSLMGEPNVERPVGWLLGVLLVSVGPPFAALSATAPLLQAWYARIRAGEPDAQNPYVLYAASNLGSMLALLAYPTLVEPLLALDAQTGAWTWGYLLFAVMALAIAVAGWRTSAAPTSRAIKAEQATWKQRAVWVLLAAAPSSLMLGLTTHISTDVASAPFLWVIPLALYLLTFVVAFQARPLIGQERALQIQTIAVVLCALEVVTDPGKWALVLGLHVTTFFFTALVCHQALVARRPEPARLTEFYLCMSIGGVLGGSFNAFAAPVIFDQVLEYPLVLALALLARPWVGKASPKAWGLFALGLVAAAAGFYAISVNADAPVWFGLAGGAAVMAAMLHRRTLMFAGLVAILIVATPLVGAARGSLHQARSFFGVHRVQNTQVPELGGDVHMIVHGSTLHGAQAMSPAFRCTPTNYYNPAGGIAQGYAGLQSQRGPARIGVVGLGSGAVTALVKPGNTLRFFEIDPVVEEIARDRRYFTWLAECARGPVDVVLGDARLTVAKEPAGTYDMIHLDAFSSDSVPTHLLTVEALEVYFRALKPDGLLLLHISNRNVALEPSTAAAAKAVGASALIQNFRPGKRVPRLVAQPSDVMILSKSEATLAPFRSDPRWRTPSDRGVRAWTDDYTNVAGAVLMKVMEKRPG